MAGVTNEAFEFFWCEGDVTYAHRVLYARPPALPLLFSSRVRVRQCGMQLNYEPDAWRRMLLAINVGKYLSAFPVIWLTGLQSMLKDEGAAEVRTSYGVVWW